MHKLIYLINNQERESWIFPSKALCNWKKRELRNTHKFGTFKIVAV